MKNKGNIKLDYKGDIIEVERFKDNELFMVGNFTKDGIIDQFKSINDIVMVVICGRDYFLDDITLMFKYELVNKVNFNLYTCHDDHILMIKPTGYNDETYHVIYEDAYGCFDHQVLSDKEILIKYKIDVNEK